MDINYNKNKFLYMDDKNILLFIYHKIKFSYYL